MKGKIFGFLAVCYIIFALVLATGVAPASICKQGWVPPERLERGIQLPFLLVTENWAPNCLVLWTSKWCASCKKMEPIVEALRKEGYTVYVYDYDKSRKLARKMGVRTLPTAVIYQDEEEVTRHVGVVTKEELLKTLRKNKSNYELY